MHAYSKKKNEMKKKEGKKHWKKKKCVSFTRWRKCKMNLHVRSSWNLSLLLAAVSPMETGLLYLPLSSMVIGIKKFLFSNIASAVWNAGKVHAFVSVCGSVPNSMGECTHGTGTLPMLTGDQFYTWAEISTILFFLYIM